jgi:hypothetical protein
MNLFVIYIGGKHKDAFIELHDIRFVLAETIEDTYEELKNSWWGEIETLHLDCWGILKSAGNYNIRLKKEPANSENKLFFVNLGGYDLNEFTELHKNVFVVAPTESKAKVQGLKQILDWKSHHRDYLYEVENIVNLNKIVAEKNLYIHLEPTDAPDPFEFTCKYVSIGKKP